MSIASEMTALANAVRSKTGGSGTLSVAQMTSAINGMTPGAGVDLIPLIGRSITSITIPSGATTIGFAAFMMCENLVSVTIPASVTSIDNFAFAMCTSLQSVTIPSGVTSIGEASFTLCTNLTSATIPASVTSIEESAFDGCPALTDIYCGFAEGAVSGAPWGAENATIHYNSAGPA